MERFKPLDTLSGRRECALKLLEESSEACEAIKKHDKEQKCVTYQEALDELADVLQCVANCLDALGVSGIEFDEAVLETRRHNAGRGRSELDGRGMLTVKWSDKDGM